MYTLTVFDPNSTPVIYMCLRKEGNSLISSSLGEMKCSSLFFCGQYGCMFLRTECSGELLHGGGVCDCTSSRLLGVRKRLGLVSLPSSHKRREGPDSRSCFLLTAYSTTLAPAVQQLHSKLVFCVHTMWDEVLANIS